MPGFGRGQDGFPPSYPPLRWIWRARANSPPSAARSQPAGSETLDIGLVRHRRRFPKSRHQRRDAWNHLQQSSGLRAGKAGIDDMIEEGAQRCPVAADVDEQDRLVVQLKLFPADDLEHLIERSDAARQDREGIGALGHQPLALVHTVDDDQFANAAMSDLGIAKMRWDDARHFSSGGEHG